MDIFCIALFLLLTQSGISIQGTVAKEGTNEPLAKVAVELQSVDAGVDAVTTTTDDGTFALRNVRPGRYRLVASRPGFVRIAYGQRTRNGPGATVSVGTGQQLTDLRIEMEPTGAIHGRIYDREGKPFINVTVHALKATYRDGHRILSIDQTTITNDLGEYRLFWLDPGQYFVSAIPSSTQLPPGLSSPAGSAPFLGSINAGFISGGAGVVRPSTRYEERATYAPTYFPGAITDQTATPINLQAGAEIGNIDIDIAPVTGRKVHGVILSAGSGRPARDAQLRVSQSPAFTNTQSFVAVDPDNGSFEIVNMVPGSYMLVASADRMTGRTTVEVGNADVDNVVVRLVSGFDLPGRVAFEGQTAADARVRIRPEPLIPGLEQDSGLLGGNGAFVIRQVPLGDYQVTASPLPDNAYIKSIRFGSTDVLNSVLRIERAVETPLEVVIGTNPGILEGRVTGGPNATVALVPEPAQRRRPELYKTTFTDEAGGFRFTGVAPGNYKVFAWEDVENGAWQNPEFIREFEDHGVPVRIDEGASQTVNVSIVPARQ